MMISDNLILAGDIGGTNARFGCLEHKPQGGWIVHNFAKLKGSDFASFDAAIDAYLSGLDVRPPKAAFAAAGPVGAGCINLTNIDWEISAAHVARLHGFETCALYNDFAGMTRSVVELDETHFVQLRTGQSYHDAPILVAGAGTGFGVGYLIPTQISTQDGTAATWHTMSTEGGHIAYVPKTALEFELLQILLRSREFVSLELVSSGSGLPIIHKAICEIHGVDYEYMPPNVIAARSDEDDPICRDICQIRAAAVMSAIGDLVLSGGARGGVVFAGGVSERMIDFYMQPDAMSRYLERDVQSDYVKDVPMRLLKSPMAPLIGAAALLADKT